MPRKNQHTASDFLDWKENIRVTNELYENKDWQYYLLFILGTHVGLRISDLKTITWDDLIRKERIILNEKKTKKKRNIKVTEKIKDVALDVYGKMKPNSRYVIGLTTQAINKKLKRLKNRYEIDINNISTHTFRKTFGRRVWEKDGYSDRALVMLMGMFNHKSLEDTRLYLGIKQEEYDSVYENIDL
jgi:integrase